MATTRLSQLLAELSNVIDDIGANRAPDMSDLRTQIDLLDTALIDLLNKRASCANKIGDLKKQRGLPIYVPERESEVLKNVQAANMGPLQDDAIRRLFERIIDETRSLERKLVQDNDTDSNTEE